MIDCQHAAIAIWFDSNPLHLVPKGGDGKANGPVIIDGLRLVQGTRISNQQQVQVNSARSCRISSRFWIESNKSAFDFSNIGAGGPWFEYGGLLSAHPGFRGPGRRVVMDVPGELNRTLPASEIDALAQRPVEVEA